MNDYEDEYELDEEELAPPKPYTPEQREMIDEINRQLADAFNEYLKLCEADLPA